MAGRGDKIQGNILLSTTSETTLIAGVAGDFHDLEELVITNTSPITTVRVDFRDTTGGTVKFSITALASIALPFPFSVCVSQDVANLGGNWTAQLSAAVSDVRIFAQANRTVT